MRVLVDQREKNKYFPQLKGLDLVQKIHVKYVGGMTLAQLFAEKLFGQATKFIEDGHEVLMIRKSIKMIITDPGQKVLV